MPAIQEFLTLTQIAARMGVTVRTLDNHFARGIGPTRTRIGSRQFVRETDFQAWLAQQAERPPSPPADRAETDTAA